MDFHINRLTGNDHTHVSFIQFKDLDRDHGQEMEPMLRGLCSAGDWQCVLCFFFLYCTILSLNKANN